MTVVEAVRRALLSPLFGVTLTLAAFWAARWVWRRTGRRSMANPVLVAIVALVLVLTVTGVPYEQYMEGARFIDFLLGPATVALALPLHRNFERVRTAAPLVLVGVTAGSLAAIASGYAITALAGGRPDIVLSMAPKSATTPISIALATTYGGIPALAAVFAITAGILGAVLGPRVLTLCRVHDERARGLAMGVASHGIGTSRALTESDTEGAFSGLAMGLNALATSLLIGVILRLFGL